MNTPSVFTSRSFVFWVALLALATLVAPASAQVAASPTSVGFNYIQRTQCNPCSSPVAFSNASGAVTVTNVAITQPTSPVAVPIFIYQIQGSTVYFGLDQGTPLYNLSYNYPAGTYSGSALVTVTGGGQVTVPLAITVNTAINFTVSPTALPAFQVAVGGFTNSQNINVSTNGAATNFTAVAATQIGGSWLLVNGALTFTGTTSGSASVNLSISANASGLSAGTYYGNITITPTNGSATNVPITLIVGSGFTNLTANPSSFSLSAPAGSAAISQNLYLTSLSGAFTYNAYFTTNPCGCISVNPGFGSFSGGQAVLTVGANPSVTNGTYSANLHVQASDGSAVDVPINFTVGTGSTTGVSLSPTSVSFYAPSINVSPAAQTVSLSTAVANVSYNAYVSSSSNWLQISGSTSGTLTAGISSFFTVYANTLGLAQGAYSGSITITTTGGVSSTQIIPVNLSVGSSSGGFGGTVAPTALNFTGQAGATNTPGPQFLGIGGSGVLYTVASSTQTGSNWLTVQDQSGGSAPGFARVSVATAGLTAGTYSGTVTVTVGGSAIPVTVTLTLTAGPSVVSNPGSVYYQFSQIGPATLSQFYQLGMSDNSAGAPFTLTSSATWVKPNITSGVLPTNIAFTLDSTGLPGGLNSATVTVAANGQNLVIPVVANNLTGSGGGTTGPLTVSPASVAFSAQSTSGAQSQTVNLYATTFVSFTAVASTTTGQAWLGVSPTTGSLNAGNSTSMFITASPSGLSAGTYSGNISLTANGINQTIPVTLTVGGGSSTLTLTPASLAFNYTAGGAAPAAQTVQIASTSGTAVSYSTSVSTSNGGNWLAVGSASGVTPGSALVTVVPNVLTTAGTYSGTVTITPAGGAAQSVPVTVAVTAPPTVSATPSTLTFTYRAGDAAPNSQQINVSASNTTAPQSFTANATTQSGGNWLSASPTSGQTPATLNVNITPGSLDPGTYTGTVTVSGVSGAGGTSTTTVTLTVTAPLPTITRVVSEASGASGALSPGEIIRIGGTAIGPTEPAYGALDSSTSRWQTTVGGVQVLINGIPSPVIAASASQVSAVVPYEVAGRLDAFVQVRFRGANSNAITLPVTTTVPGVFSQNFSGTGPGAILNEDGSVNSPSNPAVKSTTGQAHYIVIYATGEGLSRNASGAAPATGQVINVVSINDLPRPLLPVAVQIDGQPCNLTYAGSVNGQIAGLFQINAQVPPGVNSGNVSVVISVGGNSSQSGITVSLR